MKTLAFTSVFCMYSLLFQNVLVSGWRARYMAETTKPAAQINRSMVVPQNCSTAPAMTEANGISPWLIRLMILLTLLS